jgi:hypothetical protein
VYILCNIILKVEVYVEKLKTKVFCFEENGILSEWNGLSDSGVHLDTSGNVDCDACFDSC